MALKQASKLLNTGLEKVNKGIEDKDQELISKGITQLNGYATLFPTLDKVREEMMDYMIDIIAPLANEN